MKLAAEVANVLLSVHKHALRQHDAELRTDVARAAQAALLEVPGGVHSEILLGIAQWNDLDFPVGGRLPPLNPADRAVDF